MSKESKEINDLQSGETFPEADVVLDASGLYCPEPVMLIHNKIRDMNASELLEVIATDPSTTRDIPKFCIYLDHELLSQTENEGKFVYLIRKKLG